MSGELVPISNQPSVTALVLPDDLDYQKWVDYGHELGRLARAFMWWIGDWWIYGKHRYGERIKVVEGLDWDFQTCRNAGVVAKAIETYRRRDVLPWSHHAEVAALDVADQESFLDRWEQQAIRDGAPPPRHVIRNEVNAFKRERDRPKFEPPAAELADLGPFDVLYADPPWRYEQVRTDSRAIENQYPTMELGDICALQPPVCDDAILFLWTTAPKLTEAAQVIDAWGFNYRTAMFWVKDRIGMGHYVRQRAEPLLIAKRGDMPTPETSCRPDSVVEAPRGEHSVKPDIFYELIETMYPGRRYGELFARRRRPGWAAWGNEISA
jgi:N6-adenosine-specific RNA methylase IME4